jgi:MOSC domain-containing protein
MGKSQDLPLGTVARMWRYPVKSMRGEEVESADVVWYGFLGNRCYALFDKETSKIVSAKNPRKWARMFECSSALLGRGAVPAANEAGPPPVRVTLPDGSRFDLGAGGSAAAEVALSGLFGRQVKVVAARPGPLSATYEQFHPEIEGDADGGKTTEFVRSSSAQAGTYTDVGAVHIVTTAALGALSRFYPEGDFDVLRFRPNILVETGGAEGFVEREWVGRRLTIGEVELRVTAECKRCVMTTLPQPGLRPDVGILRTVVGRNGGKAGVFASVERVGKIRKGDTVLSS